MALAAAQVIDTLAARVASVPAYAGRVYTSRRWPLADGLLPAWRVYARDEATERVGLEGPLHRHQLTVAVAGHALAAADLDDTLNGMAALALAALFAGTPPNGLELQAINRGEATEGEARLGVVTLVLGTEYYVDASAPETILS